MSDEWTADGLLLPDVGRWSRGKYHVLSRYLHTFSTAMKHKWRERHFVDLFAGAGAVVLRNGGEILKSSSLIAATVQDPFTHVHLCERDPQRLAALTKRLDALPRPPDRRVVLGDANAVIHDLMRPIPDRGALCVTFADPFGLHVDFDTIKHVASKKSDLIILLADNMDALRNWAAYYYDNPDSSLDRFMGESGWREALAQSTSDRFAEHLRDRYVQQLQTLGYTHFGFKRIQNSRHRDIYTLVYASRHALGLRFWEQANAIDEGGQRALFQR